MELYLLNISDKLTFAQNKDEVAVNLRALPCSCMQQHILDSSMNFTPNVQFSRTEFNDGHISVLFSNEKQEEITFSSEFYIKKLLDTELPQFNKQFALTGYRYLNVNSYTDISFFSNIPRIESNQRPFKFVEFANRFVHLCHRGCLLRPVHSHRGISSSPDCTSTINHWQNMGAKLWPQLFVFKVIISSIR